MSAPLLTLVILVAALNAATYLVFAYDKRAARSGQWRISERVLLTLAAVGGWPAAKLAQHHLRHKTRKQPFGLILNLIPACWLGVAVYALSR